MKIVSNARWVTTQHVKVIHPPYIAFHYAKRTMVFCGNQRVEMALHYAHLYLLKALL